MTIDERIDRLVERHEALTQSVEFWQRRGNNSAQINSLREVALALINTAEAHERRISRLGKAERQGIN